MNKEELEAIASEYAHLRAFDGGHADKAVEKSAWVEALTFLRYLSENFCIVPKSKIAEWKLIVEDALKADHVITEAAFRFLWERLFGNETFNESEQ